MITVQQLCIHVFACFALMAQLFDDSVFIMNIAIIDESEDEYQEPATEAGFHSISGDAVVKPRPLAPQFCVSGGTMAQPVEPPGDEACVTPPTMTNISRGRAHFSRQLRQGFSNMIFWEGR